MSDHELVAALVASTAVSGAQELCWVGCACCYLCLCVCVFSRVTGVSQDKPVHREKEASTVGWDCQENKETRDLKDNQWALMCHICNFLCMTVCCDEDNHTLLSLCVSGGSWWTRISRGAGSFWAKGTLTLSSNNNWNYDLGSFRPIKVYQVIMFQSERSS